MKIGITGQNGFIGRHLYNYLNLQEGIILINFDKTFFSSEIDLQRFVGQCDVIVHLAAMNRHEDPQVIYDTNIDLVEKLISACEKTKTTPHILISSSTQEERDNLYGKSKKIGRELLEKWATIVGGQTTGMVIPNVFGPFGKPFYNSVVATFCHQVVLGEKPTIIKDGLLQLIYVNELVENIFDLIKNQTTGKVNISYNYEIKVSALLEQLELFNSQYIQNGVFPNLKEPFQLALFNTFRCYLPNDYYPRSFVKHTDNRGSFIEIARTNTSGQFSFSTTKPGITRGNHYHTRKAERFAVIKGRAKISIRKVDTNEVVDYIVDGAQPAYVDMPIWHTHNITNIGEEELLTLFWINEPYDPENADTYFVEV